MDCCPPGGGRSGTAWSSRRLRRPSVKSPLRAEVEVGRVVDRAAAEALEQRVEALVRWHFVPRRPPIRTSRLLYQPIKGGEALGRVKACCLAKGAVDHRPIIRQALPRGRPARRVRVAGEPVVAASRSDSDGASPLAMLQPPARTFASSPWPRGPSARKSATLRRHAVAGARRGQCRAEETLLSSRRSGAPIAGLAAGSSIRVVPRAARAASAISASACVNT